MARKHSFSNRIEKKLLSVFDTCDAVEAALGPRVEARRIRESAALLVCDLWMRRLLMIEDPLEFCGMTPVESDNLKVVVPKSDELESVVGTWPEIDD